MRIAILADIHGNRIALDAVLEDLGRAGADRVVCLGDVAAMGPHPRETVETLRALGCPVVMGNTDEALYDPPWPDEPSERFKVIAKLHEWTAKELAGEPLEYVKTFQPTLQVGDLLCCHGSPKSYNDRILASTPDEELAGFLEGVDAPFIAGGHTHIALLRRFGARTFLNPGSIGLPFFADAETGESRVRRGPAEYAILDDEGGGVEFRQVPFDAEAVLAAARAAEFPQWWFDWWVD